MRDWWCCLFWYFNFHNCTGGKERWLLCLYITLAPDFWGKKKQPIMLWKHFFAVSALFFFLFLKSLFLMCYFISNQHPFYVRWGDKLYNYKEEAKLWLSCFTRKPCPQTRGFRNSSWHEKSSRERGLQKKKKLMCEYLLHSFPFALPKIYLSSNSAWRVINEKPVILENKTCKR